jgi:outer membrane cobalamin receptor
MRILSQQLLSFIFLSSTLIISATNPLTSLAVNESISSSASKSSGDLLSQTPSQEKSDLTIEVVGERTLELPKSAPTYRVDQADIQRQGSKNVADVLRSLPGFAVNDAGFGADIHTGTYYRGVSSNQFIILLNGRPIGTNINTYHGNTDLNSIPADSIEQVELFSGASSILYGSEAFGGVVNITTKTYQGKPETNLAVEFGSLGRSNYRGSYTGGNDKLNYRFGIEKYRIDNDYKVPVGAANRDPATGKLFNADTDTTSYTGSISAELNPRTQLEFDANVISSRRGLVYFGFPLQRDRLNHDAVSVGFKTRTQLAADQSSILNTSLGYAQDYFETTGPSGANNRTGILDTKALTARVDHNWRISPGNTLRSGIETQARQLNSSANSTVPNRIAFNGTQNRDVFNTAFFAVDTLKLTDKLEVDLGLRQNINSQFGSYLNPSIGSRWQIAPQLALRASATGAQRNPGLDQLYVFDTVHGWLPNPNLKPETGATWTTGVDLALSDNSVAQISYFGNSIDNRIATQATSPTTTQWSNVGKVDTNGLEIGFKQKLSLQWSAFANYTYTDAKVQSGPDRGLQLGLIPYSVAQAGIGYANQGWELNLLTNYNAGTRRALFTGTGQTSTDFVPAFFNLDISGRIPLSAHTALNLYVENLADVQYERVNRIYSPGLTFRAGISANF